MKQVTAWGIGWVLGVIAAIAFSLTYNLDVIGGFICGLTFSAAGIWFSEKLI